MGKRIANIDPTVQVCVLNYRPEFRGRNNTQPSFDEMVRVWKALNEVGRRTVICQTEFGHIGPGRSDTA
jgi:pyruvate formate lyase activating enzyme